MSISLSFDPSQYLTVAEAALSRRQYRIWRLTYLEGWSAYRIAQALECSTSTVQRERKSARIVMEDAVQEYHQGVAAFRITIAAGGHAARTVIDQTARLATRG